MSADQRLLVIPCGKRKAAVPAPARELYRGAYFRSTRNWAESVRPPEGIRIISAKHGLLALDQVIAPYEQKMGEPGCVGTTVLQLQVAALGLAGGVVLGVCNERYCRALSEAGLIVVPVTPLLGLADKRMGFAMHWFNTHHGQWPAGLQ